MVGLGRKPWGQSKLGTSPCLCFNYSDLFRPLIGSLCVAQTLAAVPTGVAQDVLPLLQDLLQRRLQFTGKDAVLVAQLEAQTAKKAFKHHDCAVSDRTRKWKRWKQEALPLLDLCECLPLVTLQTFHTHTPGRRDKCRHGHWEQRLSFPHKHTPLCTHLNDKLVCTQVHDEHLGTVGERESCEEGSCSGNQTGNPICSVVLPFVMSQRALIPWLMATPTPVRR